MEQTQNKWVDDMKGVLETLNQGVIINDDRKRIVFANRLFLKMIGIPSEELLGTTITDLYPPEGAAALQKHIARRQAVKGRASTSSTCRKEAAKNCRC